MKPSYWLLTLVALAAILFALSTLVSFGVPLTSAATIAMPTALPEPYCPIALTAWDVAIKTPDASSIVVRGTNGRTYVCLPHD